MYLARFEDVIENNLEWPGFEQIRDPFADYRNEPQ